MASRFAGTWDAGQEITGPPNGRLRDAGERRARSALRGLLPPGPLSFALVTVTPHSPHDPHRLHPKHPKHRRCSRDLWGILDPRQPQGAAACFGRLTPATPLQCFGCFGSSGR
jgi:hypothetical protein